MSSISQDQNAIESGVTSVRESLAERGFAIVPGVLSKTELSKLIEQLGPVAGAGRRGILGLPCIAKLACSDRLHRLIQPHLAARSQPVRAIYFDKTPESNWIVAWHQDLTLAVLKKIEVPGFGPWSIKDSVPHVQPPAHLLEQMLTVRLHLDGCDESNGVLRVIPGSHRLGRLSADAIEKLRSKEAARSCCVAAGDALLMRPLLLHSSGRSQTSGHRRVVQIEYASFPLQGGLEWYSAAQPNRG